MISEPIPFLANIVVVARATANYLLPNSVSLEAIRSEFKFKKGDLNAAIRLVEQGNHKITPVGSFADEVGNLKMNLRWPMRMMTWTRWKLPS